MRSSSLAAGSTPTISATSFCATIGPNPSRVAQIRPSIGGGDARGNASDHCTVKQHASIIFEVMSVCMRQVGH
eukprot:8525774-Pyramimonas_sp.AAC.2